MTPEQARRELLKLREEAALPEVKRDGPEHDAWQAKVDAVLAAALGPDAPTLAQFRDVRYTVGFWSGAPGEAEVDARYFAEQTQRAAALIDAALYEVDLKSDSPVQRDPNGAVFVVHGRDEARKQELGRLLERTTTREAVILHEQANRGSTILEKFERHAGTASFAVILLTADDEGRRRGDASAPLSLRGRQNVILEMGFFWGQLGRSNVAVLLDEGVEKPSDLDGLVYITLDGAGAWKLKLLQELEAAGIAVDRGRIPT